MKTNQHLTKMNTLRSAVAIVAATLVLGAGSSQAQLNYGFDDGGTITDYGWTVVSSDTRQFFDVQPPSVSSPNNDPQAGAGFVGLHIPAFTLSPPVYTQDQGHNTLWIRSPEFYLSGAGAGNLTVWLAGGHGYGADATGKLVANVPAVAFDDPGNATFPSFLGIALRNVDTGVFVLAGKKTDGGNAWEQITFSEAQLLALDQNAAYTLDLLDVREGGWGWVNMDSVSIPGVLVPEPSSAALAAMGALAWFLRGRRSRKA
jgi:hypothetical protein